MHATFVRHLVLLCIVPVLLMPAPAASQPLCEIPFEAYLTDLDDVPIEGPVDLRLNL